MTDDRKKNHANISEMLEKAGKPNPAGEEKKGKTTGYMRGYVELADNPGNTLTFRGDGFWRDTRNDTLYAHVYDTNSSEAPTRVIAFAFADKNAPSRTYTVPSSDVALLMYAALVGDDLDMYPISEGTIELVNHHPEERISGTMEFVARNSSGLGYRLKNINFSIEGTNG